MAAVAGPGGSSSGRPSKRRSSRTPVVAGPANEGAVVPSPTAAGSSPADLAPGERLADETGASPVGSSVD